MNNENEQLTQEQIDNYLEFNGMVCPFCSSENISTLDDFEIELNEAWQDVECLACGRDWIDVYKLTTVEIRP